MKNMKTAYRRAGRSDVDLPWWYDNAISPKVVYDSIVMIDGLSGTVMNDEIRQELSGSRPFARFLGVRTDYYDFPLSNAYDRENHSTVERKTWRCEPICSHRSLWRTAWGQRMGFVRRLVNWSNYLLLSRPGFPGNMFNKNHHLHTLIIFSKVGARGG